jgi:hypothetical protein
MPEKGEHDFSRSSVIERITNQHFASLLEKGISIDSS